MTSINGLNEILERIDNIASAEKIEAAMGKCCALVERSAKQKAPKDTGALRNSIQSKIQNNGSEIIGVVFTPLEYAPYVEYGTGLFAEKGGRRTPWIYEDEKTGKGIFTRGQKPHPYLRPALFENKNKIIQTLEGSVGK